MRRPAALGVPPGAIGRWLRSRSSAVQLAVAQNATSLCVWVTIAGHYGMTTNV
jgi:hypothetical protein